MSYYPRLLGLYGKVFAFVFFSHKPRSFVARSVRKPEAITFPYRPLTRLISLYC